MALLQLLVTETWLQHEWSKESTYQRQWLFIRTALFAIQCETAAVYFGKVRSGPSRGNMKVVENLLSSAEGKLTCGRVKSLNVGKRVSQSCNRVLITWRWGLTQGQGSRRGGVKHCGTHYIKKMISYDHYVRILLIFASHMWQRGRSINCSVGSMFMRAGAIAELI